MPGLDDEDIPPGPDVEHNTWSFLDSLADGVPPVNTVVCVRCGVYEHGDVGEHEDDVEKRMFLRAGAACLPWWLRRLARDVMET